MGRLVDLRPAKGTPKGAGGGKADISEIMERVAKYVPAEVIAFYSGVILLVQAAAQDHPLRITEPHREFRRAN